MKIQLILPAAFLILLCIGARHQAVSGSDSLEAAASEITTLRASSPPPQGGSFPGRWINGVNCNEPRVQVHAYNEDTFIIRQSKCRTFEAPFVYLLFGESRALLLDTGATPTINMFNVVDQVVQDWLVANGRPGIRLVVAHSHAHFDHVQGDNRFVGKPYVEQIVGHGLPAVTQFFGFQNYPHDVPSYDLGGRVLDVIGTPGHHPASITLYDRQTQLLLTGDIVYPGHLFVFSQPHWSDFKDSIQRLIRFARARPVEWVVGCHIEMSDTPFQSYRYGMPSHPDEHVLQFHPSELVEIGAAAFSMGSQPVCTIFDEFVIHPVYRCGISWNG